MILRGATIVTSRRTGAGTLAVRDGRIARVWFEGDPPENEPVPETGEETIDLHSLILMAGAIDLHVHFREPGMEHKACIGSESLAALRGGVTSFVDMPNTLPPTVDEKALDGKLAIAKASSCCNYGFHIGATSQNVPLLRELCARRPGDFAGIKVFMGSSTGNMLLDDKALLEEVFSIREKCILVHSEDNATIKAALEAAAGRYPGGIPFSAHPEIRSRKACIRSTATALELAVKHGTRLHLLHVSTAEEVGMVRAAKIHNPNISAETSANYLWFSDEDYSSLGGRIKCNPSIKTARDRDALHEAVLEGWIDTIGSDHAPHLASEKARPYSECPSGIPSVGESLAVGFTLAARENWPLGRLAALYSENPAAIAGITDRGRIEEGMVADLVAIDPDECFRLADRDDSAGGSGFPDARYSENPEIQVREASYRCGWSPYSGQVLQGVVKRIFLGGTEVVPGQSSEIRAEKLDFKPF